ncbi:hypothetical protein PFUM301597_54970 [Pseudomonas fluorescens]
MRIHFVNVGQGMCHIVECPSAQPTAFMYDCGSTSDGGQFANAVTYISTVLAPMANVPVFLSHKDSDHTNWFITQNGGLDRSKFGTVRASETMGRYNQKVQDFFQGAKNWISYPNPQNDVPVTDSPVSNFSCGSANVSVVAVNAQSGANQNDDTLVLAIKYAGFTTLLTGDAQAKTQVAALKTLKSKNMLPINLVTASHHGANTHNSNDDNWVFGITPSTVIFSAKLSKHGHPKCDVVNRYNSLNNIMVMGAAMSIPCGMASGAPSSPINTSNALFTTEMNGTIAVDILADGTSEMHCENENAHCELP